MQWVWHLWSQLSLQWVCKWPQAGDLQLWLWHRWSPLPSVEKGQKEQWLVFPPLSLLLKTPTLLQQDNNKICYFPPPSAEREEWPCGNRPLKEWISCFETYGAIFFPQSTLCWPDPRERADNNPSWPERGQTGQHSSSLESAADLMYSCPAGTGCLSAGPRWLHLHYSERAPSGAAGHMAYSTSCRPPACGEFVWACLVAH